ncbi:MAG: DUF4147 domain-containing protein, partial [Nitrososphaeraceae archaeon]
MKSHRSTNRSLKLALGSFEYAVRAVDPMRLIKSSLKLRSDRLFINDIKHQRASIDLKSINSIYLIGAGKATARMALAVCEILKDKISGGAITIPYGSNGGFEE